MKQWTFSQFCTIVSKLIPIVLYDNIFPNSRGFKNEYKSPAGRLILFAPIAFFRYSVNPLLGLAFKLEKINETW
jgi:hypothetical protein